MTSDTPPLSRDGTRRSLPRVPQLDILRAIAIALVLIHHSEIAAAGLGPLNVVFKRAVRVGWIGVDLFFVLSGFLIGGLLFAEVRRTGTLDVRRFLIRRAFKIWPQYFSYLLFFFVIGIAFFGYSVYGRLHMMTFAFVHLQNYSARWHNHIWSLAVEEHFYLFLPLLLMLILVLRRRRQGNPIAIVVPTLAVLMACVLLGRLWLGRRPFDVQLHYFGTHARIDSLAAGVLLAYVAAFRRDLWDWLEQRAIWLAAVGLLLLTPVVGLYPESGNWFTHTVGFTLLYAGFSCLLVAALASSRSPRFAAAFDGRPARLLGWVGLNSYGIYLWHQDAVINPLVRFVYPRLDHLPTFVSFGCKVVAVFVGAIALGALSGYLIERPMLALRDRLYPPRTPAPRPQ